MTGTQVARFAGALLILAASAGGALQAADQVLIFRPSGGADCSYSTNACPTWWIGSAPFTVTCSFEDPVPEGAVLKQVIVHRNLALVYPFRMYASVAVQLNESSLGGHTITNLGACDYNVGRYSFPSEYSPAGLSDYLRGGTNTVTTTVYPVCCPYAQAEIIHDNGAPPTYEFRYSLSTDAVAVSGTAQTGVISHPAEHKIVARIVGPNGAPAPSQQVLFEFVSQPANATGAAIGPDETATTPTYTATSGPSGEVSATMILGNKEGAYTIKASVPASPEGESAEFVLTAKKPDRIRIVQDSPNVALAKNAYVVSLLHEPTYYAVGVDASGAAIGKVRCDWAIAASGPSAGAATVDPASRSTQTTLRPSAIGKVKLSANPALSGVGTAKADLLIGGVFLDVDGDLTPTNLHDDLPKFIPGATLTGKSVPVPSSAGQELQTVKLHVLNGRTTRGSVTFTLTQVSKYPGVAMNYPITAASDESDFDFGPAADPACPGRLCISVPFADSGNTSAAVYVRDYAARAKVTAEIKMSQDTFVQEIWLPNDVNGNGVPDGGWHALANSATGAMNHVADNHPAASDGDNDPVASGLPAAGITGDGLVAMEEYRGFVVRGAHRRLHPLRKDLFVVVHPDDDAFDDRISELPLAVHEIRPTEAVGQYGPVINPNRAGVPGSSLQRGLLARNRLNPPMYQRTDGSIVSADFEARGWTFVQGNNINLIDGSLAASLAEPESPNETLACDIFDWAFWRHFISYGPNGVRDTVVAPTDTDYAADRVIFGEADWLQSAPNSLNTAGDDLQTITISTECGSAPDRPWRALAADELIHAYRNTFLHEVAHGVDIAHDRIMCSPSIMSDEGAEPVERRLTTNDHSQIRIHRKHN